MQWTKRRGNEKDDRKWMGRAGGGVKQEEGRKRKGGMGRGGRKISPYGLIYKSLRL